MRNLCSDTRYIDALHAAERLRAVDKSATILDGFNEYRTSSFWDTNVMGLCLDAHSIVRFDFHLVVIRRTEGGLLVIWHMLSVRPLRRRSTSFPNGALMWVCVGGLHKLISTTSRLVTSVPLSLVARKVRKVY